jgi:amidase
MKLTRRWRGVISGAAPGVPPTIKDTLETTGVICTGGTKGRANYIPKADATAVARLRAAGAIFLGKTNVPELAGAVESDNLVYGRTNNPYDLTRTPGGSSGGEAAIISACGSPLGLGTDAGGSIRIPAHFCGLAAIKLTGRVPRTGQFPQLMCARGPVPCQPDCAPCRDLALALPIISGPDFATIGSSEAAAGFQRSLSGLKLAFSRMTVSHPTKENISGGARSRWWAFADAGVKVEVRT